jgi:hypothetical protein
MIDAGFVGKQSVARESRVVFEEENYGGRAMCATSIAKMKILIADGTGKIVRLITEALAAEHKVRVIARFGAPGAEDQLRPRGV